VKPLTCFALGVVAVAAGCGAPPRTHTSTSSSSSSGSASSTGSGGGGGGHGGAGGGATACAPSEPWALGFKAVREVYVAPGGAGDGSMGTPFGTIAQALKAAQPGDHVNVAAGTYDCADTYVDGTAGAARGTMAAPIWVSAAAGAVVDCGDPTQGATSALQLHGVSYLVVEGLELRNASGHVLHVDGQSTGVLFKGVFAHRAGLACLKASQSDDVSVEGSELADSGLSADLAASNASGQILDYVGVHGAHVSRSKLHGAAGNGAGSAANVAAQFKGGSHDVVFAENDVAGAYTAVNLGGSTGAQFFDPPDADYEGKNLVAYANVVRGPMSVAFAAMGCHACAVYNNTVDAEIDHQAIRALPGNLPGGGASHTVGLEVTNNLFVFTGALPQDLFNAGAEEMVGITQASNLFFAGGAKIASIFSDVPVVGTPGVVVDQDPKLTAPPGDVHLGAGSPAIGAGKPVAVFNGDRDGVCRTTWDIGAYSAK
jgi:hypothetical protein